jgi:hypothetical protein
MEMLRPGGRLLISDYCRKAGAVSKGFEKYIKKRGYDLHRCVPATSDCGYYAFTLSPRSLC